MYVSDILLAIELMQKERKEENFVIKKIENHFIYLSNGERISFSDIPNFLENRK